MNYFITGKPGVGKTTLVQEIIKMTNLRWGGFYTKEIRENEKRIGFQIINLFGEAGILAHVNFNSRFKIGRYKVNIQDLESVGTASIERALAGRMPILIDEIGKMELFSNNFKSVVNRVLNSQQFVLGTITTANISFVNEIKRRADVVVAELTVDSSAYCLFGFVTFPRNMNLYCEQSKTTYLSA